MSPLLISKRITQRYVPITQSSAHGNSSFGCRRFPHFIFRENVRTESREKLWIKIARGIPPDIHMSDTTYTVQRSHLPPPPSLRFPFFNVSKGLLITRRVMKRTNGFRIPKIRRLIILRPLVFGTNGSLAFLFWPTTLSVLLPLLYRSVRYSRLFDGNLITVWTVGKKKCLNSWLANGSQIWLFQRMRLKN